MLTKNVPERMLWGRFHWVGIEKMSEHIPAWVGDTLTPVDKTEVHRKGLRHKAVSIFVMDGEQVLIQRRADLKYHSAGLWANTCCTHPNWDERPEVCAVRRLREELGITGLYPAHADKLEYRADVGGGMIEHEVVDIYLAYAKPQMPIAPDPEEVSDLRWVGLYDLAAEVNRHPERFSKWMILYMSSHLDRIFGSILRS
ncbi:isopentenyl-diphosphate delta-isomerase [Rhodobacter aestuarii]|uniref:Isopentenyl-diphosphate Delta-isomerase n=2 Tax=Rhodobacter group TaxID=3374108 RepID=A0A1N7LHZ6_9RHOB|nr:isopentenyl-diphosphate delta-isomerase [Rhodobacter aestuarii]SIS73437.1 isopentenyl-diphosphate delta-isomerase [Rhodobacter aestuarii]SOC07998.1 isopentenyl-diphosphate delta-isomerase [Rhodobacter sp. JA431]